MRGFEPFPNDTVADASVALNEQRQHKRKQVIWAARLVTRGGTVDCIALDLSLGGVKLRLTAPLAMQQRVTVTIERFGTFDAEVVWQKGGMVGLRFTEKPNDIADTLGSILPL